MQVASNSIVTKTSGVIGTALRSTSCDRGWLQIFTHIVCGTFTVTSFIVILVVTIQVPRPPQSESRCQIASCRVTCTEAPFYDTHEDDIIVAVMEAHTNCQNVLLTLREPAFTNASLPQNWLQELRPVVVELGIIGGNLLYIPPNAFSAAFARNVEILLLEKITITSWAPHTLIGLASLNAILMKDCEIINMEENVFSAVRQTLRTLNVVESGHWDPTYLTGMSHPSSLPMLNTVDFSLNNFGAILGNASFTRLRFCKSLYLSSSRISYIGSGAFDNLLSLEYLNLNDNYLKRINAGMFDVIISSDTARVRINLVNNLWHCECSNGYLRQVIRKGVLLVDPTCQSPRSLRGKSFYEFNSYCRNQEPKQIVVVEMKPKSINVGEDENTLIHSLTCVSKTSPNHQPPTVISPFQAYPCSRDVLNNFNTYSPTVDFYNSNFWVKPILVVRKDNFTMIELSFSEVEGYGLIWYRSSCVNDIYCVNVVPDTFRLYNTDNNEYTFCPLMTSSGTVKSSECIAYVSSPPVKTYSSTRLIMLPLISVGCLFFGALILYMLIRKYPYLLKGSKRLLFVKHKTVDALVLPPKVPLREVLSEGSLDNYKDLLDKMGPLPRDFIRSDSVRSSHSCAPSYISALQPTEEQLTDWRFKHANAKCHSHYATISTISSDMPLSLSSGSDHLYFSLEDGSPTVSIIDTLSENVENKAMRS